MDARVAAGGLRLEQLEYHLSIPVIQTLDGDGWGTKGSSTQYVRRLAPA